LKTTLSIIDYRLKCSIRKQRLEITTSGRSPWGGTLHLNRVVPEIVGAELYPSSSHGDERPDWTRPTIDQAGGIISLQL
jgi:hypothetical protein